MKPLTSLLFIFSLMPLAAKADIVNEMFRIECMPELNMLAISDYLANGSLPEIALKAKAEILSKKYGIYPYEGKIVEFEDGYKSQNTKIFTAECSLKTEDDLGSEKFETYFIKIEGVISNRNPEGMCGGWRSFALSISTQNASLLNKIPFSEGCASGRHISGLTFFPHQGYLRIDGTSGIKDTLWVKNSPYNKDDIYLPENSASTDAPIFCGAH